MKKIDLHIHTKSTISDSEFVFSFQKLKEYVETLEVDCIAITNHNLFDLEQFKQIVNDLEVKVLPGIEINLVSGHLLLISEYEELEDFNGKCIEVSKLINKSDDYISVAKLKEIYGGLNKYLLIPHYDKKPIIEQETLEELKDFISSGEVASPKKFHYCIKDKSSLVPVLFSDLRFSEGLLQYSPRQTFIDTNDLSLRSIKTCLLDKSKVYLSKGAGHNFFQVLANGQVISTGLTVILGERSSGKTYNLRRISESFENIKYIKQFELLETDEERDKKRFDELLNAQQRSVEESFLKEFKDVVEDAAKIELKQNEYATGQFLSSLVKVAFEEEKTDSFSRAVLFNENPYIETNNSSLKDLVIAVRLLLENTEFRETIDSYIPKDNLINLLVDLMKQYAKKEELNSKKRWINELISNVKKELKTRTASTSIRELDFYKIKIEKEKINKFFRIANLVKAEREIEKKDIRGFKLVANTKKFTGASELKKQSGRMMIFSEAYKNYENPHSYLNSLKLIEGLAQTEYYKFFVDIDYRILNKYGFEVSGGERSEFNLLQKIDDAITYDMLLIDEPESSFDNLFLKNDVNEIIKEISKSIPVVIVTHNNTVGASIKPDYVIYTKKEITEGKVIYKVFSGNPADKELRSIDGESISNYDIMLNCLEAGNEAYLERGKSYEILKN